MRSLTPVALLAILLVAPVALAQVPPAPGAPTPIHTLTIVPPAAGFTGLNVANATQTVTFQVQHRLGNVVCSEATAATITIAAVAAGAPPYFAVVPDPAEPLTVTIAAGPHGNEPVGSAAVSEVSGGVKGTITGNITVNASVAVTVTASAPAPAGCQGAGAVPAATSEPLTIFANMTAPPPPPEPTPTPEDTPFVGFLAVAAVAVAVAFARRRDP